jgi:hypothetical protein
MAQAAIESPSPEGADEICVEELRADSVTIGTEFIQDPEDIQMDIDQATALDEQPSSQPSRGVKRGADEIEDVKEPKRKLAKTAEQPGRHPLASTSNASVASRSSPIAVGKPTNNGKNSMKSKAVAKSKAESAPAPSSSDSFVGMSLSATTARNLRAAVKAGTFQASAAKTEKFQKTCRGLDTDATFEPTCMKVQCSTCKVWVGMQEPYNTSRFRMHTESPCSPPPPPVNTIKNFFLQTATRPKPKEPVKRPQKISRPCPGLTASYDEQVGVYLDRTVATGGGARAVGHYSEELFKKPYSELKERQKQQVLTAQIHGRTWRNDTSPGIVATFSTKCLATVEIDPGSAASPCDKCRIVHSSRSYQTAINKPMPKAENLRFVPNAHQNKHAGMLFARFQGLEALMSEVIRFFNC